MSALALGIVLVAAFTHATWNLAAKRSGGGLPFVWLGVLMSLGLYAIAVLIYCLWKNPTLPDGAVPVILGSGVVKTAYALLLQRGYRHGDFSLVYPLARGTGPLLSTAAAIAIFGEHPTPLALAGGLAIVCSVFYLTGGARLLHTDRAHLRRGLLYGFTCGMCIACYTVWDQRAVSHLRVPPIFYDCGTQIVMCALMTPFALRRWPEVVRDWREHRGKAATIALLGPLGYVLILTAMTFTPVSYIAPAREISILIGTFFGAKFLKEADAPRRLLAAAGMVAGVVALALG
ncbi:MAG: EamA-like transporter family protein [Lacunisphaera sp.]|jgi:drug/metabolite transporter (DMT)-like permease|nr:EamA-like transporter family protein [Lacunisphaera sp.]